MDTNLEKNGNKVNEKEQLGDFWHGGWPYLIFLLGIIGIMVALSYVVEWFF